MQNIRLTLFHNRTRYYRNFHILSWWLGTIKIKIKWKTECRRTAQHTPMNILAEIPNQWYHIHWWHAPGETHISDCCRFAINWHVAISHLGYHLMIVDCILQLTNRSLCPYSTKKCVLHFLFACCFHNFTVFLSHRALNRFLFSAHLTYLHQDQITRRFITLKRYIHIWCSS